MDVRIVRMGALTLACVHERGTELGHPEREAARKIRAWARQRGLLAGPRGCHFFGANDPPPARPGSEYGYFSGVTVPEDVEPEGEVRLREVPAATYAVVRFKGLEHIGAAWEALYAWVRESATWDVAGHGLEERLAPLDAEPVDARPDEMVFDLWLPVRERAGRPPRRH